MSKRAEAMTQGESEARFRTLVANIPGAVFRRAAEWPWRFEYVSDAVEAITGHRPADLVPPGAPAEVSLAVPEDLPAVAEAIRRAVSTGQPYELEYRIRHADGTTRWVHDRGRPVGDGSGERTWIDGVIFDITERKQAEETLKHELNLMHALMENLPNQIYFKDRENRFTRISNAQARVLGLSDPGQAIGKTDFDFFSEEHARQAFDDEQRIMRTGAPLVGFEEKETWPDGRVTWVSTTKVPLRDANGNITGIVGISRDITEHKRMEAALTEQAETYRALFSTAFDGVVEVDEDLHIVDANRVYCRLLGYNRIELLGRSIQDLEGKETPEQVEGHMKQLQREGGGRFETLHRAKDGRLIALELNVTFIPNRGRFIAFCHDVTGRQQPVEAEPKVGKPTPA